MIGMGVVELGGGRHMLPDKIDFSVSFSEFCYKGERVLIGKPFAFVHAKILGQTDFVLNQLLKYIHIGPN